MTKPTVTSMTQALQWNKCCGNLHMKKLCMWLTNVLAKYTNTQSIMHKIIFSPSAVTLLLLGNPEGAWGLRVLVPKIDFTISLSFRFLCQKKVEFVSLPIRHWATYGWGSADFHSLTSTLLQGALCTVGMKNTFVTLLSQYGKMTFTIVQNSWEDHWINHQKPTVWGH